MAGRRTNFMHEDTVVGPLLIAHIEMYARRLRTEAERANHTEGIAQQPGLLTDAAGVNPLADLFAAWAAQLKANLQSKE